MATATASGASGTLGKGALSMFNMPTANRPDFTTRATNCALLTISVICVCVLVVCGVMIVREYALAKGYHASTCRVAHVDYAEKEIACMFCGPGPKSAKKEKGSGACKPSRFPCLRIKVTFAIDGTEREGLLHPDSLQAASPYSQCSYTICLKLPEENKRAVEEYAQSWRDRQDQTFDCFVDEAVERQDVIVSKMHTMEDVVHSMLWPSLIIVVCGCIFLRLEMKRRGIVPCPCLCPEARGVASGTGSGESSADGPDTAADTDALNCGQQRPPPYHTWCHETKLAGGGRGGVSSGSGNMAGIGDPKCKMECKLLKCAAQSESTSGFLSNSLTALDRLMPKDCGSSSGCSSSSSSSNKPTSCTNAALVIHNGKIGNSLSAEGLTHPHDVTLTMTSQKPLRSGLQPLNISDSPPGKGSSNDSVHGSRVKGLETPV